MKAKEYFGGDDLAASVGEQVCAERLVRKNLRKSPEQMHWRIANEIARIEENINPMDASGYHLLKDFKYVIPQGVMTGIGNNLQIASLSNCFVTC